MASNRTRHSRPDRAANTSPSLPLTRWAVNSQPLDRRAETTHRRSSTQLAYAWELGFAFPGAPPTRNHSSESFAQAQIVLLRAAQPRRLISIHSG